MEWNGVALPARVAYGIALACGLAYALWLLTPGALFPAHPLHQAFAGDEAASVIGQRYVLGAPWRWPPLFAPRLGAHGTDIALTDSIPLAVLLAKPFQQWLLAGTTLSGPWCVLALAVQPAAALFALRSAGERRAWPAVAIAILSVCVPSLLYRFGHTALCTHAAILAALGLYLRLVRGARLWPAALALLLGCVLIHPYIFVCVAALLAAVPCTLLLRGGRQWRAATAWLAGGVAAAFGLAVAFGFGGRVHATSGFGFYSMNLLAPFLPDRSWLLPTIAVDATGGQAFEGFQYLGAGLLLLSGLALWQVARGRLALRPHAGLAAVLLVLWLLAGSNIGFAGRWRLYDLPGVPEFLAQFHATGRFFWPVTYTCLVAGVLAAARLQPRAGMAILALACLLQVADTATLRRREHRMAINGSPWVLDTARLRPVFASHSRLTQWPVFGCGAWTAIPRDIQVTLLASETLMQTNTAATARDPHDLDCDPAHALGPALAAGELRVVLQGRDAWLVPGAASDCRQSEGLSVCAADPASLAGLSPLPADDLPGGAGASGARLAPYLVGWGQPEPGGTWTKGDSAALVFAWPPEGGTLVLSVVALAPVAGGTQRIDATLDGSPAGRWRLADLAPSEIRIRLAPGHGPAVLRLRIGQAVRPVDRGLSADTRRLGLLLRGLRVERPPTP